MKKKKNSQNFISSLELREDLLAIDAKSMSAARKKNKKISLLKTQIQIRKKVLSEALSIPFTSSRKKRPLNDIVKELCDNMDKATLPAECALFFTNPTSLIGRKVMHRFVEEEDRTPTWYSGTIIEYSHEQKNHCLIYEGDPEQYHFHMSGFFTRRFNDLLSWHARRFESSRTAKAQKRQMHKEYAT